MTYTTKTDGYEYETRRVAVIGGGAAGMMAAVTAAELGARVVVFEKNDRVGKKLRITGKGRCNVTNDCSVQDFLANVPTNPRFLYTALSRFSVEDTKAFFENEGVPLKVERGNRVFPVSDRAADIVAAMHNKCRRAGVEFTFRKVTSIFVNENGSWQIRFGGGESEFDAVIIATGGRSYPLTGSDGDAIWAASSVGHPGVCLCRHLHFPR